MEVSDITSRIERILLAVSSRIDHDFKRHIKIDQIEQGVQITLPAIDSKVKVENDIYSILQHLATLKDHIKNHLEFQGKDKKIVEGVIDSSLHLKILIDLVNAEKHGYPTKKNRSGRNPIIRGFGQGLRNNNDGKEVIASFGTKGEFEIIEGKAPSVELYANIYDEGGNFIFGFNELVEVCCAEWMSIVEEHLVK